MSDQCATAAPAESSAAAEHAVEIKPMFHQFPVRKFVPPPARGVCIEIIERAHQIPPGERGGPATINVPSAIVLDGVQWYVPANTTIDIKAGGEMGTVVTLTLYARRVRVGYEDELRGPIGQLPGIDVSEEHLGNSDGPDPLDGTTGGATSAKDVSAASGYGPRP